MTHWDSNGHVTDDVTWPRKVKVVTPICLTPNISKTDGDRDLGPMDHQKEMAYWDSNGHVTDDVTWPRKVTVVTSVYLETWVQWTTNRKWPIGIQMVTWLMTSRVLERSRSWPQYIWGLLSRQWLEIRTWCQWSTYTKWLPGNQMVTWPMTSPDPERLKSCLNILKPKYLENGWR